MISSKWDELFSLSESTTEIPDQNTKSGITEKEELLADTLPAKDSLISAESKVDTTDAPVIKAQEKEQILSEPKDGNVIATKKFYIVAGSFKSIRNAEKLVKRLNAKGYNSEIFGATPKGLQMVSYEGYENRKDAGVALKKIMREENTSAWIIKY